MEETMMVVGYFSTYFWMMTMSFCVFRCGDIEDGGSGATPPSETSGRLMVTTVEVVSGQDIQARFKFRTRILICFKVWFGLLRFTLVWGLQENKGDSGSDSVQQVRM
ncbi:hypothetical protein HanXRQr2_Chr16g0765951 [Helianthus annuus]|uniref:Uncharacterized protein n=1 Tax=Helianthus annuus TaxID=4232 RepID=A0A9K3DWA0_HELAN|nr:hypothetical protein HanXRQr2_Chr16g0765941 [Helianthus annuus]KAF5761513.1 hypothetical protein HanXRQr2_Chr16g0765951 [Helianthus annuus]KAJ0461704.1 hypothetical protein HanHA89_Chr16g0675301 [Helianthus annuus]KAJ0620411.1 hypothetical protein HanHA300_Chr00c1033g0833971 [Helianthus annuus]KAJ0645994.1 hypothetical protein HanOQP8_Chr16g0630171 [Helianthus annuus]